MSQPSYTILLGTFNEEARLEATLKMFHGHGRLMVVDNYSNDRTVEIAKQYTSDVFLRRNEGWFSADYYQFAFDAAPTDYVLIAMVGRYYPPELLRLYARVATEQRFKAVAHYVQMFSYGRPINTHGRPYRNRTGFFQFFNKKYIDLSRNKIHAELPFMGKISDIYFPPKTKSYCVLTLRDDSCHETEIKYARYCSEDALARFQRGQRTSAFALLRGMGDTVLRGLVWRGAIWQGMPGLITTWWGLVYMVNMHIKLWELQNHLTRPDIQRINAAKLQRLNKDK